MREIAFIFITLITIGFGFGVVFSKNAVYSAFNLVLCFFGLSGIYILWGATFIAMIQVLIYTGAIVVLFLFVVMLLEVNRGTPTLSSGWWMIAVSGAGVWLFAVLLLRTLNRATVFIGAPGKSLVDLRTISRLLFSDYLWPFEILSIFLLALIVAVFALARPEQERT